jgi:hypothetical protein
MGINRNQPLQEGTMTTQAAQPRTWGCPIRIGCFIILLVATWGWAVGPSGSSTLQNKNLIRPVSE